MLTIRACAQWSSVCKRFRYVDGHLRAGEICNDHHLAIQDFCCIQARVLHCGNVARNKDNPNNNKPKKDEDSASTGSSFISRIFSLIEINPTWFSKTQNSKSPAEKQSTQWTNKTILSQYEGAASMKVKEDIKQKPGNGMRLPADQKVIPKRKDFNKRQEIGFKSQELVRNLRCAVGESVIVQRAEYLISHLLEYPDARNTANMEGAISILKSKRLLCQMEEHREILNRALVLMGHIEPPMGEGGIRVLTLDGGGMRGLCAIEALQMLEQEYNKQLRISGITRKKSIYEMFDYVSGVSTGCILAAMIFLHRTPLQECKDLYRKIGSKIFEKSNWSEVPSRVKDLSWYDTSVLEKYLDEVFADRTMVEFGALDHIPKLSGISCIVNIEVPTRYIFRTYNLPPDAASKYEGSCKYKSNTMLRASCAAPFFYKGCQLGDYMHVDGAILSNNPSAVAVHECKLLWPDKRIHCLISVGTGRHQPTIETMTPYQPASMSLPQFSYLQNLKTVFQNSVTDTEEVHNLLQDIMPKINYYRFNPYFDQVISMDSTDERLLDSMEATTRLYMKKMEGRVTRAAGQLMTEKKRPLYNYDLQL